MHRWQVGDIEVVRIEDAAFSLPTQVLAPSWFVPHFAPNRHEIRLAFSALALQVNGIRVVIDPWLADDGPRERPDAADHVERLLAELAVVGFPADAVDVVVNSHFDGVGWNTHPTPDGSWVPTFPNARYLYPTDELAAIGRGELDGDVGAVAVLDDAGLLAGVNLPCTIAPGVELVSAPGHDWGHAAVRISSGDELAIVPGHLILSAWQVHDPASDHGDGPRLAEATATRRALLEELAAKAGWLLTTLVGGPGGGRVHPRPAPRPSPDSPLDPGGFWLEVGAEPAEVDQRGRVSV